MSQPQKTVLMTGATGSFGRFLALELLKDRNIDLILLVRGLSVEEARSRVLEIVNLGGRRVKAYRADLTEDLLGLRQEEYDKLRGKTTHLLHSAASTRFNLPVDEAQLSNVATTEKMIEFAKNCPNLVRFGYLSTALVAGKRSGIIKENEFEHSEGFTNSYQQTKYKAESLIRAEIEKLSVAIFRPPLIVAPGFSDNPRPLDSFFSILLSLVAKELLPAIPGNEKSRVDLVYAPDAAFVVTRLFLKEKLDHLVYHITNGSAAFTVRQMVDMIEQKVGKKLSLEFFGRDTDRFMGRVDELSRNNPKVDVAYKRVMTFLFEPAYSKVFDNNNTLNELGFKKIGKDPISILNLVLNKTLWNF